MWSLNVPSAHYGVLGGCQGVAMQFLMYSKCGVKGKFSSKGVLSGR